MKTYKWKTLEVLYSRNPNILLFELKKLSSHYTGYKTLIAYGKNPFINLKHDKTNVIVIKRSGMEYKGFLNTYKLVS